MLWPSGKSYIIDNLASYFDIYNNDKTTLHDIVSSLYLLVDFVSIFLPLSKFDNLFINFR